MSDASDVEQFFNWINKTKRIKPCYQSIDMRGKVSAPCSRFMVNERVHYLDQKSFGIFQEGLKRNRGLFTVDVYNAVVQQDRSVLDKGSKPVVKKTVKTASKPTVKSAEKKASNKPVEADIIKFGYYPDITGPSSTGSMNYEVALSWYFEETYAQNSTRIPFFVMRDDQGKPVVHSVALGQNNKYLASFFFNNLDRYNFSPLMLPGRLQTLQENKSLLLVMYRHRSESDRSHRIHSAAETEFSSREAFLSCVQHAFTFPEVCVVKVSCEQIPVATVPKGRVNKLLQRLQDLSAADAQMLADDLKQLLVTGYVTDMTLYARRWVGQQTEMNESIKADLAVWVGTERRSIVDETIVETLPQVAAMSEPELIRFGYVERRREHRYLARTAVSVLIDETRFEGFSSDISWHGLRVKVDKQLDVEAGMLIHIGFPTMQEKRQSLSLMNIPYRVVHFLRTESTMLMLERVTGTEEDSLDIFFDDVIEKNRNKLKVDAGDVISSIKARMFESLAAINTDTIAFFIGRHKIKGAQLLATGVPVPAQRLMGLFDKNKSLNPGSLLSTESVRILFDAIHLHGRKAGDGAEAELPFGFDVAIFDQSLDIMIADEYSSQGFQNLQSMTDWEKDKGKCRILRLVATSTAHVTDKVFEQLQADLRQQSAGYADKLEVYIAQLVGCGEIMDVTDQYRFFWP
ncbi:MAG: PilZ domain-containing protein [Gammaproteobacteria bacterium]